MTPDWTAVPGARSLFRDRNWRAGDIGGRAAADYAAAWRRSQSITVVTARRRGGAGGRTSQ